MHSQGGHNDLKWKGDLLGSIECYFYEKGIVNIIFLSKLQQKYKVTFKSSDWKCSIVHKQNGSTMIFNESPDGLYYHDTAQHADDVVLTQMVKNATTGKLVFVDTVAENQEGFTKQQIAGANAAWDAYKMLE